MRLTYDDATLQDSACAKGPLCTLGKFEDDVLAAVRRYFRGKRNPEAKKVRRALKAGDVIVRLYSPEGEGVLVHWFRISDVNLWTWDRTLLALQASTDEDHCARANPDIALHLPAA